MADNSIDLYKLMGGKQQTRDGIKIVKVVTAEPDAFTFMFEGTKQALGPSIFEIPVNMYPIREGDRFTAFRMFGSGPASRWAFINKLNGCTVNLATMQGPGSAIIDGIGKTFGPGELIAPVGLLEGDRVTISPVYDGTIKYAVLNKIG